MGDNGYNWIRLAVELQKLSYESWVKLSHEQLSQKIWGGQKS